ncbi:MAG: DUF1801 domain-containing protein [Blastocatellia bacterium]
MKTPNDVDSYIMAAPESVQVTLTRLRCVIKNAAPRAAERISYGMPFYEYGGTGYKGRLIYFAAFKKHISLFITPWQAETVPPELAEYHAGKATYRFPLDKPIPFTLIGKTVKALVRERNKADKTGQ